MNSNELKKTTRGITAARLAEITSKATATIQSYLAGRAEIPADVALKILKLERALNKITEEGKITSTRNLKSIINGKTYNTQTATLLAEYDNGGGFGDFHALDEGLYLTKNGTYFLAGSGGAMTKYCRSCGHNSTCGGSGITPISIEEAKAWMESYGSPEEYIAAFGEPEEA